MRDAAGAPDDAGFQKFPIVFEHAVLSNLRLTYRVAGQRTGWRRSVADRRARIDNLLAVVGKGSVGEYPATLSGELGPCRPCFQAYTHVDPGVARQAECRGQGAVGRLYPLAGADLS
jgi:hypothetical protein